MCRVLVDATASHRPGQAGSSPPAELVGDTCSSAAQGCIFPAGKAKPPASLTQLFISLKLTRANPPPPPMVYYVQVLCPDL